MIENVAVANRGEIASRVFATCRRLGIETLALHSDPDAALPYVRDADAAARLSGSTAAETYLDAERIIGLVRAWGGQSVHPGYGFLSENADFARAVTGAGLVWIGPPPEAIELMGDKVRAKAAVSAAGVPILADLTVENAAESDLPLLVKASAGGGGRGMRVVRALADLPAAVDAASDEAASAFGDGTVFIERYVERSRHIEVQVLADTHGAVVAVGDRDCSLQRRHQKVVEEAPAPGLADDVRRAMHDAAVAAARACGYVSAGTVEFLYDVERGEFAFLEMNTRLQVEHPVTECVTGVDLVAAQIGIAEGRVLAELLPLDGDGAMRPPHGHAVEVRLYAEDADADFTPQAGRLGDVEIPHDWEFDAPTGFGVRLDAGYTSGSEVSTHYDAMLAKVIAWGPDRSCALRMLRGALRGARVHGVLTNLELLRDLLRVSGEWTTQTVPDVMRERRATAAIPVSDPRAPAAAVVALAERDRERRAVQRGVPVAWRNVPSAPQQTAFEVPGREDPLVVRWWHHRDGYEVLPADDDPFPVPSRIVSASPTRVVRAEGAFEVVLDVALDEETGWIRVDGPLGYHATLRLLPRFTAPADAVASGSLLAPMPGTVVRVAVEPGAEVAAGDVVLVLEAMKMQHTVTAPHDGTVTEIHVEPGAQVAAGEVLAVVEEHP